MIHVIEIVTDTGTSQLLMRKDPALGWRLSYAGVDYEYSARVFSPAFAAAFATYGSRLTRNDLNMAFPIYVDGKLVVGEPFRRMWDSEIEEYQPEGCPDGTGTT